MRERWEDGLFEEVHEHFGRLDHFMRTTDKLPNGQNQKLLAISREARRNLITLFSYDDTPPWRKQELRADVRQLLSLLDSLLERIVAGAATQSDGLEGILTSLITTLGRSGELLRDLREM